MNSLEAEKLEKRFKETIEKEKSTGLFSLAIIFGLVISVGGNVFYDWFVKSNPILGIAFLISSVIIIAVFMYEVRHSLKILHRTELGLKILERIKLEKK